LPPISDKKFIKKKGKGYMRGGLGQNPQKRKQEQKRNRRQEKKTEDKNKKHLTTAT